jgi:hypothetical protein
MNHAQERPTDPGDTSRLSGEVDGLLRAFFRAEMPEPWPQLRLKGPTENLPSAIRPGPARSRGILAASVLLLFTGYWCVSGMHSDAVPDLTTGVREATIGTRLTEGQRRMSFTSHKASDAPKTPSSPADRN